VHAALSVSRIEAARAAHPGAPVLVHPECDASVRAAADACLSTGGMCAYARTSPAREIIVGTETGILHRLRAENPEKAFYPVDVSIVCADMKKITLEKICACLRDLSPRVSVDADIAAAAKRAIDAMLAVG
jgi:quinolinate synthase